MAFPMGRQRISGVVEQQVSCVEKLLGTSVKFWVNPQMRLARVVEVARCDAL